MKDLKLFATDGAPLHPSGMRALITCPWRMAMQYLFSPDDEGGVAGDTGSAMHVAVAEFHRGKEVADCVGAMGASLAKYPKADLTDAAGMFLNYAQDNRNRAAKVILVEQPIKFYISPAPEDETQAQIAVIGTLDQVREVDGRLRLDDLKTTKRDPVTAMHDYMFQIAAYVVGASVLLGKRVDPGALIFPRKYKSSDLSNSPVFWHYAWKFEHVEQILLPVRHAVANVRAGRLWHIPSDDCKWCPSRTPDVCLPKLRELQVVT